MNVGIIGTGRMGRALAGAWTRSGCHVFLGSRDRERGRAVAKRLGGEVRGGTVQQAVEFAPVVALVVPWRGVSAALEPIVGALAGKTLIDCTNPLVDAHAPLVVGRDTSGAEEIAELVSGASVIKAFNAISSRVVASGDPSFAGRRASIFYCGDDSHARETTASLIDRLGFEACDAGPLSSARYLEPLAALSLQLDRTSEAETEIVLAPLRRTRVLANRC